GNRSKIPWFHAAEHGMLPEWMSPTCSTNRTFGSELIESMRRGASPSSARLYGQSPYAAKVRALADSFTGSLPAYAPAVSSEPASAKRATNEVFKSGPILSGDRTRR